MYLKYWSMAHNIGYDSEVIAQSPCQCSSSSSILSALIKRGTSSVNTLNEQLFPEGHRRLVSDLDASIQDTNTHHR